MVNEAAGSYKKYERTFCFYCGTSTKSIAADYLHNNSGVNLWMLQDWRCSLIICDECNKHSGGKYINYLRSFDEVPKSNPFKILSFEPDVLIPSLEKVWEHFIFEDNGYLVPKTVRAELTINRFALNRTSLVRRRLHLREKHFSEFKYDIHAINIHNMESPIDIFFLSDLREEEFKKQLFNIFKKEKFYANSGASLLSKTSYKSFNFIPLTSSQAGNDRKKVLHNNISKLSFTGLRGFEVEQELEFSGRNSIVMLGENGVGKSTLLEIIYNLFKQHSIFKFRELNGTSSEQFQIKADYEEYSPYIKSVDRQTGRKVPTTIKYIKENRLSKGKIKKLVHLISKLAFDEHTFFKVSRQLKQLLDLPETYELRLESGDVFWINVSLGNRIYFSDFSSGYTSILTIFYEIYSASNHTNEYDEFIFPHVVLIDELELHLHPKFKKRILDKLQSAFSGILFIVTTHDPLVLCSANKDTLIVSLSKVNGKTRINQKLPNHRELTTEQLLTSPIFGLSTISGDDLIDNLFIKYYEALKEKDKGVLSELRRRLASSGYLGRTFREYIALSAVDSYLAKNDIPPLEDIEEVLNKLD